MATFDMSASKSGVDLQFSLFGIGGFLSGSVSSQRAHSYAVAVPGFGTVTYGGTAFTYLDPSLPTETGVIKSIQLTGQDPTSDDSKPTLSISGLSIPVASFEQATGGAQLMDWFQGGIVMAGDDVVIGSKYNDLLIGGLGNNRIDGGAGIDTVSYEGRYSDAYTGVIVDLALGKATFDNQNSADNVDTLISIENVYGTDTSGPSDPQPVGIGGDLLYGNAAANTLWGLYGNDTLDGRAGDDILNGGNGDDLLIGGLGNDTADYSTRTDFFPTGEPGAVVDLLVGESWGAFGHDLLSSIENVNGSAGDDWIQGSNAANTLAGNLGADTIYGLGGNDIIFGGAGDDALYGGVGNDRIESGEGVDYVEGGDGNDVLIDDSGLAVPHEWSALYGGSGNDTIEARGLGDVGMWGGTGNDTLIFGAGNVSAYGGSGADVFKFGTDNLIGSEGSTNYAQIYDFELGVDHLQLNGRATVVDWAANTGIDIVSRNGSHETIMLMGVTSAQLQSTNWQL